jgi:hypothetical protein
MKMKMGTINQLKTMVGMGWVILGMAGSVQAASVNVFDVYTSGQPVSMGASAEASAPMEDQTNLTIAAKATVAKTLVLSSSATQIDWKISAPGYYMANVYDLTIENSTSAAVTKSGFDNLTGAGTPGYINTMYTEKTDSNKPGPTAFWGALENNWTEDVAPGVTTRHVWMRLNVSVLPEDGDYVNNATITIGPSL